MYVSPYGIALFCIYTMGTKQDTACTKKYIIVKNFILKSPYCILQSALFLNLQEPVFHKHTLSNVVNLVDLTMT